MNTGKFRFSKLDTIGNPEAESDEFLSTCFIDTGYLSKIKNLKDNKTILLGRTGSGKTALLLKLIDEEKRTFFVYPENLALAHVSNSTILKFLLDLGINLDIFFKLLWRHVLTVELLKKHQKLETEEQTKSWLDRILPRIKSKKLKEALDYLEEWGSEFWKETDYRVREVTEKLESDIVASLKTKFPNINTEIKSKLGFTEEKKAEILERAQKVVNKVQIDKLTRVLELLDFILDDEYKRYYIVIDKLDEDWVESTYRLKLIRALIETAKDFLKVKQAKIIISLRDDLLQQVFDKTRDAGFQREKYLGMCLHVTWNYSNLILLLNARVTELIKRRYTKEPVKLEDVFPKKIDKNEETIMYILDRTLLRPRDAISFFNKIIELADDRLDISKTIIKNAELNYSNARLEALADEWYGAYPFLVMAMDLLQGRTSHFEVRELIDKRCENICINIIGEGEKNWNKTGKIFTIAKEVYDDQSDLVKFCKNLVYIFYSIGLVGVKLHTDTTFNFISEGSVNVQMNQIQRDTKIAVHKTFWRALNIKP